MCGSQEGAADGIPGSGTTHHVLACVGSYVENGLPIGEWVKSVAAWPFVLVVVFAFVVVFVWFGLALPGLRLIANVLRLVMVCSYTFPYESVHRSCLVFDVQSLQSLL